MPVFPVFLKLEGRRVVMVGGGKVAASKLRALLDAQANVTVVAPHLVDEIVNAPVEVIRRGFEPADLDGACYVVAAAPREVNADVAAAAQVRGIFVNAVDDVEHASVYLGAVVRRAGVTVAISTDGEAPALAALVREALDALLPDDLDRWMTCAKEARQKWLADGVPMEQRRPLLLEALVDLYADRRSSAGSDAELKLRATGAQSRATGAQ